jgi:hypothetical protein
MCVRFFIKLTEKLRIASCILCWQLTSAAESVFEQNLIAELIVEQDTDLTVELIVEQVCRRVISSDDKDCCWLDKVTKTVNVNCSEICFLMTDRMKVLDSCSEQHDETFILFLSFAFMTDEIEVNRESLKTIVFQHLESLSWELEIYCDCEHESEESDFEEMTETSVQDIKKACEQVIFWCLTDCLIFVSVIFERVIELTEEIMFSEDWTDSDVTHC